MFDLFRSREKSVRVLLGVMLLLVAGSMLVYLVPGGFGGSANAEGEDVVAAVGSEQVTITDVRRQIAQLTHGQTNLPKGMLAMYVPNIVNQLVEQKAMAYKARELGLTVSDQELDATIKAEFASQMGGKFDVEIFKRFLAEEGMTGEAFDKQQRESMLSARLENMERQALVIGDADARAEYQRKNMKVAVEYVALEPKQFLSKLNNDPAAVKAYFDKNRQVFRVPEKRSFNLIVGVMADFVQSAQVPETQLKHDYSDSLDSFRLPESWKTRRILINHGKSPEEAPKLKAKAEQLLKQIQGGANFAELAKKNSEDTATAEKGGDLGWVVRGKMGANFEKALFSLKPGETSGVVDTEYGYDIIQVEAKQDARLKPYEEVRPELLEAAKKDIAADTLHKNLEAAHAEVERSPLAQEAIATRYGLKFFKLENQPNGGPLPELPQGGEISSAIFSAAKGATTDVINMDSQGRGAFAVVSNVMPARNAEFAEVQGDVMQRYAAAEEARLTEEAAKAAVERAHKGETLEAIAKEYGVGIKTAAPFAIDGAAEGIGSGSQLAAAFKANVGDVIAPISTPAGQVICRVSQKIPADMNQYAANKEAVVRGLEQEKLQLQQPLFRDSVVNDLKRRGKVKMNPAVMSRLIGQFEG